MTERAGRGAASSAGSEPAGGARAADLIRTAVERDGGIGAYAGSRAEGVASYLEAFISRAQLPDGAQLGTKPELAGAFGVALSTLNEAMQILVSRRRIKLRQGPGGGAFVDAPRPVMRLAHSLVHLSDDAHRVADAAEVRDALEPTLTRNALRSRTEAHLDVLRERVADLDRTETGTDLYLAVLALHAAVADACGNDLLRLTYLAALETVRSHTQRFTVLPEAETGTTEGALRRRRIVVHRKLVSAIETQDPSALDRALKAHAGYRGRQH